MAIPTYLAMTAAEFQKYSQDSGPIAWMACHFSPYSTGLANLPAALPEGSLLIVNDRIPYCGHDPSRISLQLQQTLDALGCSGIILDFQREGSEAMGGLADALISSLPCPVAVSDRYAGNLACAVFLSPCPHHESLKNHISPWHGRDIWLDLAVDAESITLTDSGAVMLPLPLGECPEAGHGDKHLHCHYSIETSPHSARFTLWRTREDLTAMAREAEELGVKAMVGLYQELREN